MKRFADIRRQRTRCVARCLLLFCALLATTYSVHAQPIPSDNPLSPIADHLDRRDMLVGWLDINASTPQEVATLLHQFGTPALDGLLNDLHQLMKTHGVQLVYVTAEPFLRNGGPLILLPAKQADGLTDALAKSLHGSSADVQRDESVVLIGVSERIERAMKHPHAASAQVMDAAKQIQGPHGLVFVPDRELHEAIAIWSVVAGDQDREVQTIVDSLAGLRAVSASFHIPLDHCRLNATFDSPEQAKKLLPVWRDKITALQGNASLAERLVQRDRQLDLEAKNSEQANEVVRFIIGNLVGPKQASAEMDAMKQIALALHNYESQHGQFPPQSLVDANGRKLLSWRVLILPFLGPDAEALYKQFRLNEPWDSNLNRSLLGKMPAVFGRQGVRTTIQAPLAPNSVFGRPGPPATFANITDGTSVTAWLIQVPDSEATEWTRPDDWVLPAKDPLAKFRAAGKSMLVGRADGSVQRMSSSMDEKVFRALINRDGGELINEQDLGRTE